MFTEQELKMCLDLLNEGRNLIIIGAIGTGKSTLLRQIKEANTNPDVQFRDDSYDITIEGAKQFVVALSSEISTFKTKMHNVCAIQLRKDGKGKCFITNIGVK